MGPHHQEYLFSDDISKECSAAIEELSRLESTSHASLLSAYNNSYADTLRRRLVQAEEAYLSEKLARELQQEKAQLGGTFYGWTDEWVQTASARDIQRYPLENIYSTLVSTQNHRIPLNNPDYAAQFFDSMLHAASEQSQSSTRRSSSSSSSSSTHQSQTLEQQAATTAATVSPANRERMVGGTVNGRIRRGVTTTNSARPPLPEAVLASSASDLSLNGSRPVGMASRNLAVASETDLHSPESAHQRFDQGVEGLNTATGTVRSNNRASRRPGRSARIVLPSSQRSSSSNLTLENNIDLLISSRRIQHQQRNVAVASAAETVVPPQEPSTSPQTLTTTTQVQTAPLPLQSPNPVIVQEYNEDDADSGGFDDDDDEDTLYSPTPRHARSRSLNTNFQNTQSLSLSANTGLGSSHARHARSTTMRPSSSASFHYFHNTQARRPPRPRMVRPSLFLSAPRKTTSQLRLEKELADKEAKLRAELATKFRANPVPSTSLVPKYSQIMKTGMTKAAEARAKVIQEMRSKRKPIAFLTWNTPSSEESKSRRKPRMGPEREKEVDNLTLTIAETLRQISLEYEASNGLLATPGAEKPKEDKEKVEEIEDSRTNTKPQVVKETLVPHVALTAAEDGRRKRRVIEEQEKRSGLTDSHTFRPNINPTIPDFDKLQQHFESKLNSNKGKKPKIKITPFPGLEKHQVEMEIKPKKEPEPIQKKFTINRSITSTIRPPATEVKSTKTFELKKQAIEEKAKKEAFEKEMQNRLEIEKKIRQFKIAVKIRSKISSSPATSPTSNASSSPRKSAATKEYQRMLSEMKYRLEERPLIFERQNNKDAELKKKTGKKRVYRSSI